MIPTPSQLSRSARTVEARQVTIEEWLANRPKEARGQTVETQEENDRLNGGCLRIYNCLRNLDKWTLPQLAAATGMSTQSASARWREVKRYLEKDGKGRGHREPTGERGHYTYRISLAKYFGAA